MKYEEIAEKLKKKQMIMSSDVSGMQVFMLLHDRLVKNVKYHDELYEINFIPMEEPMDTTIRIDDKLYPKYRDVDKVFKLIIDLYKKDEPAYIDLDGEYYQIILDILETE